jgi:hypothetical protein
MAVCLPMLMIFHPKLIPDSKRMALDRYSTSTGPGRMALAKSTPTRKSTSIQRDTDIESLEMDASWNFYLSANPSVSVSNLAANGVVLA